MTAGSSGFGAGAAGAGFAGHGEQIGDSGSIPTSPGEFLMRAGADPFGGLNADWNAAQAELFAPPPAPMPEHEGGGE
jgi:hypothetical protein